MRHSAACTTITGAVSIMVPAAIGSRANTPRPRSGPLRISTRRSGFGQWRSGLAPAGIRPRSAGAQTRSCGRSAVAADAAARRRDRWRNLCRRGGRLGFVVLPHPGFERLDALGEVAHHPWQLAGTEKDQDDGQNHDPVHQAEGTHNIHDPGTPIKLTSSDLARLIASSGWVMRAPHEVVRICPKVNPGEGRPYHGHGVLKNA